MKKRFVIINNKKWLVVVSVVLFTLFSSGAFADETALPDDFHKKYGGRSSGSRGSYEGHGGRGGHKGSGKGHGKHSKHQDIFRHIIKSAEKLGLSDKQVKEITAIGYDFKKDHIKMKAEIEITKVELQEVINAKNFDEKEIINITDDISEMIAKCYKIKTQAMIDVLKILTDKQRKKINSMHSGSMLYSSMIFSGH